MVMVVTRVFVLMLSLALMFAQLDPRLVYEVVKANSRVEFFVDATLGEIDGVFSSYDVEFKASTLRFEDSSFRLEVASQSVRSGNDGKDKMIKGQHFFWVERYPSITFVSRQIVADSGNPRKFAVPGDLTIRGVTKPATL